MNQNMQHFRQLGLIFGVAALVNYPWELAQSPLYAGTATWGVNLWHCLVASLGDGVLVLAIFAAGLIALRRMDWYEEPGAQGYIVMLLAGLAIALAVEWGAVHVAQRWAYTDQMPRIPGLDIGIVPVAQMLVLPPLIFRIVATLRRRKR